MLSYLNPGARLEDGDVKALRDSSSCVNPSSFCSVNIEGSSSSETLIPQIKTIMTVRHIRLVSKVILQPDGTRVELHVVYMQKVWAQKLPKSLDGVPQQLTYIEHST